jgi:hypothetical protein
MSKKTYVITAISSEMWGDDMAFAVWDTSYPTLADAQTEVSASVEKHARETDEDNPTLPNWREEAAGRWWWQEHSKYDETVNWVITEVITEE